MQGWIHFQQPCPLKARGVPTAVHYPIPIHRQPAYTQFGGAGLSVSEQISGEVLSLPMYPDMTEATQDAVVAAIKEAALDIR